MARRLLSLALLAAASALCAADDFESRRMSEGKERFVAGDFENASIDFRIAAFGSMGAPPRYEECLIWLALSEKRAGMTGKLAETLQEIARAERAFPGAYDGVRLGAREKADLETMLVAGIPPETLLSSGRFAGLIRPSEKPAKKKR